MFKPDPRLGQIRQVNPRVGQPEPEETEPVTYKFLEFGQKFLSNPRIGSGRVVRHVRNPTLRPRYERERLSCVILAIYFELNCLFSRLDYSCISFMINEMLLKVAIVSKDFLETSGMKSYLFHYLSSFTKA
jgi:hypothetical protein